MIIFIMDFARKQLEKYGWAEGKGLGKRENGISTPLKPKLKFDNTGLGHDVGEQFTNNWWEKLFNSAAENLTVEVDQKNEVKMKIKSEDSVEISTKSYSVKELKKNKSLEYGSFLKTTKLTGNTEEHYNPKLTEPMKNFQPLTDDELFAACGGRTAHKGARHGLKLNGKLSRIEKQEKMLLKKMKKVSLSDSETSDKRITEKKLKKLKKQKEDRREKYTPIMEDSMESISSNGIKRKKKRKSVSFNETVTVTEIYRDLDTSFESEVGSVKDENSNEPNLECIASGSDEGIEQDIENNNNEQQDNHKSFEVGQFNISDLSKAERKKLKKKRKLEAKKNTSTGVFLQKLNDDTDETMIDSDDKDKNLKKRKFLEDCEHNDYKNGSSKTESPGRHKRKRNKIKKIKQKKFEEKQINSIVQSLDSVCRISESE